MKPLICISYILSLTTLIIMSLGYIEYQYNLGIPDGYISEYSHTTNVIYKISVFPFIFLIGYFGYLGWVGSIKKINKKLLISLSLLLIFIVILATVDKYLYIYLDHGQGG